LDALLVINAIEADRNGYVLTDITSLGSHYLKATFDAPVMGAVLSPDAYVLTSADSNRVEVMSAALGENPNEVILAMAAPLGADIEVRFNPAVTAAISTVADLQGNSGDEIYLETSIARQYVGLADLQRQFGSRDGGFKGVLPHRGGE
jgi:hypothetical protein